MFIVRNPQVRFQFDIVDFDFKTRTNKYLEQGLTYEQAQAFMKSRGFDIDVKPTPDEPQEAFA